MEKQFIWNEGDGSITTVDGGSGNTTISLSSNENIGIDRAQELKFTTKEGLETSLLVKQPGLREYFIVSKNKVFTFADDNSFNVLKDGI